MMLSALDGIAIFRAYPPEGQWYVALDETPSKKHRASVKLVHSDGRFIVLKSLPIDWPERVFEVWTSRHMRMASACCLRLNVAEMKRLQDGQRFRLD